MIWITILLILVIGVIYVLYRIGKDVKAKEEILKKMMSEKHTLDRLKKYKRKSTPKTPTIQK